MNIAIIPARGGSKRIPDKNIKLFSGKPIISYSIEAAKISGLFEKIIVSTDSQKIAHTAKEYGAEVPFMRPKNLSDDFTPTAPVRKYLVYVLKNYLTTSPRRLRCCCMPSNGWRRMIPPLIMYVVFTLLLRLFSLIT